MAEGSTLWTDDQTCPICLDLLKQPVTIPCGHSYCMSCISDCWDQEDQKRVYSCPRCRQTFTPRVLRENTMLGEVVEKLKKTKLKADRPVQCSSESGDVECDVCTGDKNKAVKSCMTCLNSFCQNHLKEHDSLFKDESHSMMDVTKPLQEMICPQHEKPLEYFCRTDQQCICYLCMREKHLNHETVSLSEESFENQRKFTDVHRKNLIDSSVLKKTPFRIALAASFPIELSSTDFPDYGEAAPFLTYRELENIYVRVQRKLVHEYKSSVIKRFLAKQNPPSGELDACYTEPVIIQRSKEQMEKYCRQHVSSLQSSRSKQSYKFLTNDKNHNIRINQLFSPDSDGNTPKTVILIGDSGRGKSIMLQKIMLNWASGELYSENFDVVFLLKFENLKCISDEISLNELLSWSCSLTPDQISQILELIPEKVLILIDGVDECVFHQSSHFKSRHINPSRRAPPMDTLMNLMRGILLPESYMLVTTRSGATDVMNLLKGPQRFTEIVGFSERGVQEYFQKFFQDELFRKRYDNVKTNEILLSLCSVPLLCWMVCCCLKKNFKVDNHEITELKTTTSIYVHFVTTLLKDYRQSVLSLLRNVGWLAEKELICRNNFSLAQVDLGLATSLFLYKDDDVRVEEKPVFKFIHFSFQEFFTALRYVLLDEEESRSKVHDRLLVILRDRPSVMMILCGLLNEEVSSSLFEKIKWTAPHTVKRNNRNLKKKLMHRISLMILRYGFELFALRCLYELQDEEFTRRALLKCVSVDLSYVPLRSTDCWVLLYCLQLCPHIRDLNLMYCELTAKKLQILQPALHMCGTLRLTVEHLSKVGELIRNLDEAKILKELKVQEDENRAESPRWSLDLSVTNGDVLVSLSSSEKNPSFPAVLNISLRCPQSQISSTDWTLFLQRLREAGKLSEDFSSPDKNVSLLLSSFHSMGLKTLDLKVVSLNESWASGIICLVQTCTSLQQLRVSVTGLLLEEGLVLLEKSLMDPDCTVIIEGRKCSKPSDQCREQDWSHSCNQKVEIHFKPTVLDKIEGLNISEPEESDLNPHPLPVCESCVHIADSDEWVHVEPSVWRDEAGSEFRIRTPAGRFECSRTTLRWVCAGDVTLLYRLVDGGFLNAELERFQFERIGPVIDVTVISGKLEEAHLPHYICLAESDPSLTDVVKLLSVEDEGLILESVELTRFHARILQPNFSPKTLLIKLGMPVKVHCDLLIFMTQKKPIILHVYFFPSDSLFKEKIKTEEKSNHQIKCSRPETPLQMMKQHSLEVTGADVQPKAIKLRGDIQPNFFQVRQPVVDNFNMTLSRVDDQKSVWTATIWKELTTIKSNNPESNVCPTGQKHKTQVAHNFDKAKYFDTNWCHLIQSVKNVKAIADKLLHKEIIHEELYSEITHPNSTSEDSMRKICSSVRKGSVNVKDIFISILLEETPNLLNHLPLSDS